ncbi:hypothetical protein JCM5353_007086 [Sporobolomyces roseus]
MNSGSQDGWFGILSTGQRITWSEAVNFLNWYSSVYGSAADVDLSVVLLHTVDQFPFSSWQLKAGLEPEGVERDFGKFYVYTVEASNGSTYGRGRSLHEDAAKRCAEINAALYLLDRDSQLYQQWSRIKAKVQIPLEWPPRCIQPTHREPARKIMKDATNDKTQMEVIQDLKRKSLDAAKELASTEDSLDSTKSERDILKRECEQLRTEVKELKEEQERTRNEGCQNCQCSTPEPSLSSTESSLSPLAEIASPEEVSLQLLYLHSELSRMKLRLDVVEKQV